MKQAQCLVTARRQPAETRLHPQAMGALDSRRLGRRAGRQAGRQEWRFVVALWACGSGLCGSVGGSGLYGWEAVIYMGRRQLLVWAGGSCLYGQGAVIAQGFGFSSWPNTGQANCVAHSNWCKTPPCSNAHRCGCFAMQALRETVDATVWLSEKLRAVG